MTIYEARFRSGPKRSRNAADRTHAWCVTYRVHGELAEISGFSSSLALAEDAVARHGKQMRPASPRAVSFFETAEIVEAVPLSEPEVATPAPVRRRA